MSSPEHRPSGRFPPADRTAPPEEVADEVMRFIGRGDEVSNEPPTLISRTSAAVFAYETAVVRVSTDEPGSRERLARGIQVSAPFFVLRSLEGIVFPSIPGGERLDIWGRTANALERGRLVGSLDEIAQLGEKLGRLQRFPSDQLILPEPVGYLGAHGPHSEFSISHHAQVERRRFYKSLTDASRSRLFNALEREVLAGAANVFQAIDAKTRADFVSLITKYSRRGMTQGDAKLENGLASLTSDFVAWSDMDYFAYGLQVADLAFAALSSPLSADGHSPDRASFESLMRGFRSGRGKTELGRLTWSEAVALSLQTRLWWVGETFQAALHDHTGGLNKDVDAAVWERIDRCVNRLGVLENCTKARENGYTINDDASGPGRRLPTSARRRRTAHDFFIKHRGDPFPQAHTEGWRDPIVADISTINAVVRKRKSDRVIAIAGADASADDFAPLLSGKPADALVLRGGGNPPREIATEIPIIYWCTIGELHNAYRDGKVPATTGSVKVFVNSDTLPDVGPAVSTAAATGEAMERKARQLNPSPLNNSARDVWDVAVSIFELAPPRMMAAWKDRPLLADQVESLLRTSLFLQRFAERKSENAPRFSDIPDFGPAGAMGLNIRDRLSSPRTFAIADFCMGRQDTSRFRERIHSLCPRWNAANFANVSALALAVDMEVRQRLDRIAAKIDAFGNDPDVDNDLARVGPEIIGDATQP